MYWILYQRVRMLDTTNFLLGLTFLMLISAVFYATGGITKVSIYLTGAEIAILDSDHGSIDTKNKLELAGKNSVALSANHLQKMRLSFTLSSPLGKAFKPHQVLLKLRHETNIEHGFLDGLVIIGGVTSNTDAAQLAETFAEAKCPTKVVGVPVTLNGDLKNQFVETDVGFDAICKVNSQLIGNVRTDPLSAEKIKFLRVNTITILFRLMGRKASHVALECTLQSHPNMVILGEEVVTSKLTLFDITKQICDAVQARADQDKYHGVVLLPEGLIESIPEVYALLQEIHGLHSQGVSMDNISSQLSPWASALFEFLPPFIKKQLLLRPESDDSAQLSQIETEKLLAHLVETEMNKRTAMMTVKRHSRGFGNLSIGKAAIHLATVDFKGKAYEYVIATARFLMDDNYRNPGPLQFDSPGADAKAVSLCVEDQYYMGRIKQLQEYLDKVRTIVKPGCSQDVLKAALSAMSSVTDILSVMSTPSNGQQTYL
ncbi:hypothetical protein Droror1_Dr00005073 [Drosera rotundifolia]